MRIISGILLAFGLLFHYTFSAGTPALSADNNPTAFLLKHCRIILSTTVIEDGIIAVRDGKIVYAGKMKNDFTNDYKNIEAKGLTALPALINAHAHDLFDESLLSDFLKGGVGSVCDFSPRNPTSFQADRKRFNTLATGSRLYCSTPIITVPGGYGHEFVTTPDEAQSLVRKYIAEGVDLIKISIEDDNRGRLLNVMSPDIIRAITAESHAHNKKVAAHITHTRFIDIAAECGVDIIGHTPVEVLTEEHIETIKKHNMIITPSLELWKIVSIQYHTPLYSIQTIRNIEKLNRAGVKIALGTDYGGFRTYGGNKVTFERGLPSTEIVLMKEAGMSNMQIIHAATEGAAEVLGDPSIGSLREGMRADIILVKGSPDRTLSDLSRLSYVILDGVIHTTVAKTKK